jgi:hypothetical protein
MTTRQLQGTIHGRRIDLQDDPGLADGVEVDVIVRVRPKPEKWGEGIRRSAGAWADMPELDGVFEEIERERKSAKFRDESP